MITRLNGCASGVASKLIPARTNTKEQHGFNAFPPTPWPHDLDRWDGKQLGNKPPYQIK